MTAKLVLFDCDGVLVDTEPTTDAIISTSLTRHGLQLSPHEVGALFVGGTIKGIAEEATRRGATLPPDWIDRVYAECFSALAKGVDVFDGVIDLMDRLDAADIETAIISNGPMRKMEVSLTPSGLKQRFAGRIYSGHDYVPKPDPTMIHIAMRNAGVIPAQTVFIDDSLNGAKAGIAAGVRTLGFAPAGDDGSRAALGAEPVRSMAEIAALLGV